MALMNQYNPLGGKVITDTDVDSTAVANATGAASNIHYIEVDNTANAAASYFKLWNHAAPTVGTTVPDVVVRAKAATKEHFIVPQAIVFGTALSYACVTVGGTAGTGNPTSAVIVRMIVT